MIRSSLKAWLYNMSACFCRSLTGQQISKSTSLMAKDYRKSTKVTFAHIFKANLFTQVWITACQRAQWAVYLGQLRERFFGHLSFALAATCLMCFSTFSGSRVILVETITFIIAPQLWTIYYCPCSGCSDYHPIGDLWRSKGSLSIHHALRPQAALSSLTTRWPASRFSPGRSSVSSLKTFASWAPAILILLSAFTAAGTGSSWTRPKQARCSRLITAFNANGTRILME